jgi:hypothetical protein
MRRVKLFGVVIMCLIFMPVPIMAGSFDGSVPLLCATIETFACVENSDCQQGTPASVNIPQFVRINFKTKTISGEQMDGEARTSKIGNIERLDDRIILQGTQNGKGWSVVITKATGKMAITASDNAAGFVVFGACTSK